MFPSPYGSVFLCVFVVFLFLDREVYSRLFWVVDQEPAPEARHAADQLDLLGDRPVLRDLDVQQPLHHPFLHPLSLPKGWLRVERRRARHSIRPGYGGLVWAIMVRCYLL